MTERRACNIPTTWEDKCWGRVIHIFYNECVGVSHLEVKRGCRSSIHRHVHRTNDFCVHTGTLLVQVWPDKEDWWDQPKCDNRVVTPDRMLSVPAGLWHRFRVIDSGTVTEVYTPDGGVVRFDDIERFDVGGTDNTEELEFLLNELGLQ